MRDAGELAVLFFDLYAAHIDGLMEACPDLSSIGIQRPRVWSAVSELNQAAWLLACESVVGLGSLDMPGEDA